MKKYRKILSVKIIIEFILKRIKVNEIEIQQKSNKYFNFLK